MAGIGLKVAAPTTAFLIAFVGGTAAIVLIRAAVPGLDGAMFATGVAVVAIALLGVWHRSRGAARVQQAGDDLYYLGLLFTLVSLIHVLVQLFILGSGESAEARMNQLVGNFGIALVSTVAGIVGRVLLQTGFGAAARTAPQTPREPMDERTPTAAAAERDDEFARLHADTLRELRDEVRQARDAFSHFTRMTLAQSEQTRTHTERLVREFDAHMTELAQGGLRDAGTAWQDTAQAMRGQAEQLVARIDTAVDATAAGAEATAANATARTEAAWQGLAARAETATAQARANVDAMNTETAAMLDRLATVNRLLPALSDGLESTRAKVDALGGAANAAATGLDARAAEIVSAHNALARGAKEYSEVSVEAYRAAVDGFLGTAEEQLRTAGERWLRTVEEFQDAGRQQQAAGEQAAASAEELTRRMAEEAKSWAGLAERTRQAIVAAVDDLADVVRKARARVAERGSGE